MPIERSIVGSLHMQWQTSAYPLLIGRFFHVIDKWRTYLKVELSSQLFGEKKF